MGTTRTRFLAVALAVSFFAVGMAAFLNYFKYKSTVATLVQSRVLLVGTGIDSSIQASLALGIPLQEMSAVAGLLEREKSSERSIRAIDVFDDKGKLVRSTDATRAGQAVPAEWLVAANDPKKPQWRVEAPGVYVTGLPIKNSFDLVVGHIALHYAREEVDAAAAKVGRDIALKALAAFAGVVIVLPFILFAVMRRFTSDLEAADAALDGLNRSKWQAPEGEGGLAHAVGAAGVALKAADAELVKLRLKLDGKT